MPSPTLNPAGAPPFGPDLRGAVVDGGGQPSVRRDGDGTDVLLALRRQGITDRGAGQRPALHRPAEIRRRERAAIRCERDRAIPSPADVVVNEVRQQLGVPLVDVAEHHRRGVDAVGLSRRHNRRRVSAVSATSRSPFGAKATARTMPPPVSRVPAGVPANVHKRTTPSSPPRRCGPGRRRGRGSVRRASRASSTPARRRAESGAPAVGATGDDALPAGRKRVDRRARRSDARRADAPIIDAPQADVALALDHQQPPGVGGIELTRLASRTKAGDVASGGRWQALDSSGSDEQSGDAAGWCHAAHS